jgi:hypothetical protein
MHSQDYGICRYYYSINSFSRCGLSQQVAFLQIFYYGVVKAKTLKLPVYGIEDACTHYTVLLLQFNSGPVPTAHPHFQSTS